MNNFEIILLSTFIVFSVICIALCIQAHYRYKKKAGIDNESSFLNRYEYFGQPVYNQSAEHQGPGYELLLREFNPDTRYWQLPQNVANFPLSKIVETIQRMDLNDGQPLRSLALNMTVSQMVDYHADYFFTWVLGIVDVQKLIVEINKDDILSANYVQQLKLRRTLKRLAQSRIYVAIENVDSSAQTYERLRKFLPYTDYLKFNINAFNKSATHWIDITLAQWKRKCARWNVVTMAGKIEKPTQEALVDQLHIGLRQGYFYGQPTMLHK